MGDLNWLTVVTAALLLIGGLLGYINGLIKTILNLVIGAVTLLLVLVLSPRVNAYLQTQTGLVDYIGGRVEGIVWEQVENMQKNGEAFTLDAAGQQQLLENLPFLPTLKEALQENELVNGYADQGQEAFVSIVSSVAAGQIVILLAYFATFVVVFFVLRVMMLLLNVLEHLPLLHGINKLAGLAFGLAEGLLAVWLLGLVLTMAGTTQLGRSAAQCIGESPFLTAVYGNNLLQQIIFWSAK